MQFINHFYWGFSPMVGDFCVRFDLVMVEGFVATNSAHWFLAAAFQGR